MTGTHGAEQAYFLRPAMLPGVEALHATFVDHRYAPHIHETLTLAYVDRGAAAFALEGERFVAPAECVFVIPPQAVHTGESASDGGYTYRVLYLDTPLLAERGEEPEILFRFRRDSTVMQHRNLAAALANVHSVLQTRANALGQAEAVTELLGLLRTLASGSEPRLVRRDHRAVRKAQDYIREHWRDDFTLGELAATVGLSPAYLCRLFARQVGMPPSSYRRSIRVEHARRLLRAGAPAVRVAASCGFHDQAHLTRHFKHATGVTPSSYARA